MQKSRVRRVGALLVGLSLVAAACGDDDEESTSTEPDVTEPAGDTTPATEPPTETTPGTEPTDTAETAPPGTTGEGEGGELAGMRGTTPKGADVSDWIGGVNDAWVAKGNTALTDFNYAAESYDAVIVIALAAAAAGTDGSALGDEINGITGVGEKCTDLRRLHGDRSTPEPTSTTTASPARSTSTATVSRWPEATRSRVRRRQPPRRIPTRSSSQAQAPESAIVDAGPGRCRA